MALNLTPNIGPWSPKISQVMKMWVQPCNPNLVIWMAGYMAASPTLIMAFLEPDCLDYTADRFRGGPRRMRRGGINIADLAKPITPGNSGIGQWAFNLLGAAQRVGFYLTIVSATIDWVIMGTSLAYQWTGCDDPEQGHATLIMEKAVPLLLPATTSIIYSWSVQSSYLYGAGPTGIAVPRGQAVGCGFSITQITGEWLPLPDCSWSAELYDRSTDLSSGTRDPVTEPNGNRSITWFSPTTGDAASAHKYEVLVHKDFGVFYVDGFMSASGSSLGGLAKSACGHSNKGGF